MLDYCRQSQCYLAMDTHNLADVVTVVPDLGDNSSSISSAVSAAADLAEGNNATTQVSALSYSSVIQTYVRKSARSFGQSILDLAQLVSSCV